MSDLIRDVIIAVTVLEAAILSVNDNISVEN